MKSATKLTRRRFLQKSLAAGAVSTASPYIIPGSVLGADGHAAVSNRIAMGCIGVGPQGTGVMNNFLAQETARVVAVCDVKAWVRDAARTRVNQRYQTTDCAAYNDFRELLARNDIDAVSIATPDHWHVPVAIAAAKAGKHIYVEKPMGITVAQDQSLREAIHRYGVMFQFGTQQRSSAQFRLACELVRNRRIGKLRTINVWSPASNPGGSLEPAPIPEGLDYDLWLGPARYVPYTKDRCSNALWWFNSDYAVGFIAGWGIHPMDIAVWGGGDDLAGPIEVEGAGVFPTEGFCDTATNWNIQLRYGGGVTINYTGLPAPNEWQQRYGRTTSHGTAFEGTEGWVHVDREGINTHPRLLLQTEFSPSDTRLTKSTNHAHNLLDAIQGRTSTVSSIDESVRADILCHISDIAARRGRALTWDPTTERFVNDDDANRLLSRSMRAPWHL